MSDFDLWNGKRRKGDDDGRVPFNRKAMLWFAHALRERLTAVDDNNPMPTAAPEEVEGLVQWYSEESERYVKWIPADAYRGKGFSAGGWGLDIDSINSDLSLGRKAVRRRLLKAADGDRIKSLDDWLRADFDGSLNDPGAVGGTEGFTDELIRLLQDLASRRRRTWPRLCKCGASFKPDRANARTCPACRQQKHATVLGSTRRRRSK